MMNANKFKGNFEKKYKLLTNLILLTKFNQLT